MIKIPRIGIPAWKVGDNSLGITTLYYDFIEEFGSVVIINPVEQRIDETLDLIVLPGGPDVNPERYGQIPKIHTSKQDPLREYFDTQILPEYIKRKVAIFGICRGFQSLAVMFDCHLEQHMYHETSPAHDRSKLVHKLDIINDLIAEIVTFNGNLRQEKTTYYNAYGNHTISLPNDKKGFEVNSLHHQAVFMTSGQVEEDVFLRPLALYESKDGLNAYKFIEAFIHKTLPIAGVQYHPEELIDEPISKYLMYKLLYKL